MEYTVDGLLPFTEYRAELSISNMYTIRRHYQDTLFSIGRRFTTREGGNYAKYFTEEKFVLELFCQDIMQRNLQTKYLLTKVGGKIGTAISPEIVIEGLW